MFHVTFVLILHFDWLQGPHIGQNFEKHSKIFFSETVKGMRPKIKLFLFPLSRPTVKKSPDRKNFISIFHLDFFFFFFFFFFLPEIENTRSAKKYQVLVDFLARKQSS